MFNVVNNPCEKVHVLNFCCLAKPQNFFTIENFANYGTFYLRSYRIRSFPSLSNFQMAQVMQFGSVSANLY